MRALEQVRVLEQIRLVGEHLLDTQRPLLVPRAREAQRLIPGRQLYGSGPGVAGERHPQRLQNDALHIVLGLGLGQSERVDLDSVPEASLLRILDAVPVPGQLVPQPREGAHLAHLFDEPHTGVDEEGDAAHHVAHPILTYLAAVPYGVEYSDRGSQSEAHLLYGCSAGFLKMVGADVDWVPLWTVGDGPRHHVGREPQRGAGREDVRAAREVLLHDVVLRRTLQRVQRYAL